MQVDTISTLSDSLPHIRISSDNSTSVTAQKVSLQWYDFYNASFKIKNTSNENIIISGNYEPSPEDNKVGSLTFTEFSGSLLITLNTSDVISMEFSEVTNSLESAWPVTIETNSGNLTLIQGDYGIDNSGIVKLQKTNISGDDTIRYGTVEAIEYASCKHTGVLVPDALHYMGEISAVSVYAGWGDKTIYYINDSGTSVDLDLQYCPNIIVEFDTTSK